ncbi:hypothetical protein AURDEDRAFT_177241 [Auricularia subglabra TFB-10046 SS5]|uniref:Uncharacterized protein n=1 Tax=Auricularia subglabra (strain TFB-10046 / SS5) TaxID=717982 RepID=J0LB56_AURST|nr:hypothetical protein AURDEDRAFT_177241 [Auricularia subglabra TFB-10046 SS5]
MSSSLRALLKLAGVLLGPDGSFQSATPTLLLGVTTPSPVQSRSSSVSSIERKRHTLVRSYRIASATNPTAPAGRFRAVRRFEIVMEVPLPDDSLALWVSKNCRSRTPPPPPDPTRGPYNCDCTDMDGQSGPRYGDRDKDSWMWSSDHFDATNTYRAFIPDLFEGEGPCFKRKHLGITSQWDAAWVVETKKGFVLRDLELGFSSFISATIDKALLALDIPKPLALPSMGPTRSAAALRAAWADWVSYCQICMGLVLERLVAHGMWDRLRRDDPGLWKDMEQATFFDHPPLGVWFRDTDARVDDIIELISQGVPVFYRWSDELARDPAAAPLRPLLSLPTEGDAPAAPYVETGSPAAKESSLSARRAAVFQMAPRHATRLAAELSVNPGAAARAKAMGIRFDWDSRPLSAAKHDSDSGDDEDEGDAPGWEPRDAAVHTEGFEQGISHGVRSLAQRLGFTEDDLKRLASPEPEPEPICYHLTKDVQLTGRVSAVREAGKRKNTVTNQVARVFRDYEETGGFGFSLAITASPLLESEILATLGRPLTETQLAAMKAELLVYDVGVVDEQLKKLVAAKKFPALEDLVNFCLQNLIRFAVALPAIVPLARDLTAEASVHGSWWVTPDAHLPSMFNHWVGTVEYLLKKKDRVYFAALARGGLLARIARQVIPHSAFPMSPSATTRLQGSPSNVNINGRPYQTDWIDGDEVLVLLGSAGPTDSYARSLWPPLDMFDARYAGVWTQEYETWFKKRFRELKSGARGGRSPRGLCSRRDWDDLLKNSALA